MSCLPGCLTAGACISGNADCADRIPGNTGAYDVSMETKESCNLDGPSVPGPGLRTI